MQLLTLTNSGEEKLISDVAIKKDQMFDELVRPNVTDDHWVTILSVFDRIDTID